MFLKQAEGGMPVKKLCLERAATWWPLGALFESALAADLTFKGGTSLSKAYKIIDRFSEDPRLLLVGATSSNVRLSRSQ